MHSFKMFKISAVVMCASEFIIVSWTQQSPPVFGHVHIAKTGGSSLNRVLAREFHGVCGHKGYSYDQPLNDVIRSANSTRYPEYGPDRVHPAVMRERGFHNCALISLEESWRAWAFLPSLFKTSVKVMLLPCRNPIDHVLSMCNHKGLPTSILQRNCSRITECFIELNRFDTRMARFFDLVFLFHYLNISVVEKFVGAHMTKRSFPLEITQAYSTNIPRQKHNENLYACQSTIGDILTRIKYFKICDSFLLKSQLQSVIVPAARIFGLKTSETEN